MAAVMMVVATLLISGGAAWIYPPAGVITLGVIVGAWAIDLARDMPANAEVPG